MSLKIIGSGLGRTGTMSMKRALEQIGFGPCHHMVEVFQHPESIALWVEAGEGKPDWNAIFQGYQAMVDYPGCRYWRELMAFYPDAKVLHTTRDPDEWFDSTQATIFAPDGFALNAPPHLKRFFDLLSGDFGGRIHDRAFMTEYFRRHDAEVLASVPKDRLLIYRVGEGWNNLCAFLGVAVPAAPFPSENSREEFRARTAQPIGLASE
ncbi:MAG: sulfotransferase family protein [Rhizomicrobium sp.]|jgi:hypothetical protein